MNFQGSTDYWCPRTKSEMKNGTDHNRVGPGFPPTMKHVIFRPFIAQKELPIRANKRILATAFLMLIFLAGAPSWGTIAQTNPHGPLSIDCMACHTVESWNRVRPDMQFDHNSTEFPLEGRHEQVSCRGCHSDLSFAGAGTECVSCHTDIHQNQFGISCDQCHSPSEWINELQFRTMHNDTRFPLIGVHANLDCQACHATGEYNTLPLDCGGCHFDTYSATTNPNHTAAQFSVDCSRCHRDNSPGWQPVQYEHTSAFPLTGGHRIDDCADCHQQQYVGLSTECYSCHQEDFLSSDNPTHDNFPTTCDQCHTITAWQPADFDHTYADFQLEGAHLAVSCEECHAGEQWTGIAQDCYVCHEAAYTDVADPDHTMGQYEHECLICHQMSGWLPAGIDDHGRSGFPLYGQHALADCDACHGQGYNTTPSECYPCHETDYQEADNPVHTVGVYDSDCSLCHGITASAWTPAEFDHQIVGFTLDGAHLELECLDCHTDGYANTPGECYGCHQGDYEETEEPDHIATGFPTTCEVCHTTSAWEPAQFDHADTDFPLTGAHVGLACDECHADGYTDTPTECFACHDDDYSGVNDPVHVLPYFDHGCTVCHTTAAWNPSTFDHNSATGYSLEGAHQDVSCAMCHPQGVYDGTPQDCWSCHQAQYDDVTDPIHNLPSFDHVCTLCHTMSGWTPSTFDHNTDTDYTLEGAHTTLNCAACHPAGVYDGTADDCWSCHQSDYEGTTDPDHSAGGYPQECTVCHSQNAWTPAQFDHDQTDFPLTGAHNEVACIECHENGYTGTPTACFACHEADYNDTDDPPHGDAGFPTTCETCHTTNGWEPANWSHNDTGWPLTGAHVTVNCDQCHINGQYTGTPTECFFCHEDDYNDADDPNHLAAGFPTTCETCHSTSAWEPANFDHIQWFPIYTGTHRGEWNQCSDCHTNPGNYSIFSCIDCHEHNRAEMDDEHDEVGGYSYNSEACYNCHPDGRAGDDLMAPFKVIPEPERKIK